MDRTEIYDAPIMLTVKRHAGAVTAGGQCVLTIGPGTARVSGQS